MWIIGAFLSGIFTFFSMLALVYTIAFIFSFFINPKVMAPVWSLVHGTAGYAFKTSLLLTGGLIFGKLGILFLVAGIISVAKKWIKAQELKYRGLFWVAVGVTVFILVAMLPKELGIQTLIDSVIGLAYALYKYLIGDVETIKVAWSNFTHLWGGTLSAIAATILSFLALIGLLVYGRIMEFGKKSFPIAEMRQKAGGFFGKNKA